MAKEALAKKAIGKRKRPAQDAEERVLWRLRKGHSTPNAAPLAPVEKVGKGLPDLPAIMTTPLLLRSAKEGSSRQPKAVRERIRGALLPDDIRVFEHADPEGLIGWSYAFSDFISDLPTLFSSLPFPSAY